MGQFLNQAESDLAIFREELDAKLEILSEKEREREALSEDVHKWDKIRKLENKPGNMAKMKWRRYILKQTELEEATSKLSTIDDKINENAESLDKVKTSQAELSSLFNQLSMDLKLAKERENVAKEIAKEAKEKLDACKSKSEKIEQNVIQTDYDLYCKRNELKLVENRIRQEKASKGKAEKEAAKEREKLQKVCEHPFP